MHKATIMVRKGNPRASKTRWACRRTALEARHTPGKPAGKGVPCGWSQYDRLGPDGVRLWCWARADRRSAYSSACSPSSPGGAV